MKKALVTLGVLTVLGIGGCSLIVASIGDSIEESQAERERVDAEVMDVTSCEVTGVGALDWYDVDVTATNESSERSDFWVDYAVRHNDGTRIGTGWVSINDVQPDETVTESDSSTIKAEVPVGQVTCEVLDSDRTASEW